MHYSVKKWYLFSLLSATQWENALILGQNLISILSPIWHKQDDIGKVSRDLEDIPQTLDYQTKCVSLSFSQFIFLRYALLFMNSALYAVHEQLKNICSWTFFVNHWCSWKVKTMAFMKSALYAVHEQCIICRSWTAKTYMFMNIFCKPLVFMEIVNDGVHEWHMTSWKIRWRLLFIRGKKWTFFFTTFEYFPSLSIDTWVI